MVPADDEHKSANEAEKNTSTQKNFVEKLKFWKRCNKDENKPERLTPMPPCLMKWWVPFGLAGLLLVICTPIAFLWGGQFHWPSADGISVCITIAGAALAVSTWQQRNDDNAIKEQERAQAQRELEADRQERDRIRLEQIERDEYWKRREHILHTLDSNNPGIRLAAVSLLAELADSAAHSNLLNPAAQQQLQQHIISTLCLQLRHEGYNTLKEGSEKEHADIQQSIIEVIQHRINQHSNNNEIADWTRETITLNNAIILSKVSFHNIHTSATLNLDNTEFTQLLRITNSDLGSLEWENATFPGGIRIGSVDETVTLHTNSIPQNVDKAQFINTIFITDADKFEISLKEQTNSKPLTGQINLFNCAFWIHHCSCTDSCECKSESNTLSCECKARKRCTCPTACINAPLTITDDRDTTKATTSSSISSLTLNTCRINKLRVNTSHATRPLSVTNCEISNGIVIMLNNMQGDPEHKRYPFLDGGIIKFINNLLITHSTQELISIGIWSMFDTRSPFNPINVSENLLISPDDYLHKKKGNSIADGQIHTLKCTHDEPLLGRFHFEDKSASSSHDQLVAPWDTGRLPGNYILAMSCSQSSPKDTRSIRLAHVTDSEPITTLYSSTYERLAINRLTSNFASDFQDLSFIEYELRSRRLHVVSDKSDDHAEERIIAAFTLSNDQSPDYPYKTLKWRKSTEFLHIDHIVVRGNRNVVRSILSHVALSSYYIRCISSQSNKHLRHALEVFGFKECDTFTADDGSTRIAYDWIKEPDPQD